MGGDLAEKLRQAAPDVFADLPVRWAYLYGSQAKNRARPDSDIDVAVILTDDVASAERALAPTRFADALSTAAQVGNIEVVVLNDAPLRFVGRVLRQRMVIFTRDEPGRVAYESLLGRMADDVEIWAALLDRELLVAIAEGRALTAVVDPLRVRTVLDRLGREVAALRRLAGMEQALLLADEDLLAGVKYRFIVAIEACIDVGRHVVASEGWRVPRDYADVFAVLGEDGVLPVALADTLRDTARFRNLLVHEYVAVDDDRVVQILRTRLADLRAYRGAMAALVGDLS